MANIDKAFMEMSLADDDDVPFNMPNLPEYCSRERNAMSIIGRTLNPECQNMADLILDMPRKWQLYDRVRGIALTSEKFQFIFKYEHDLEEVMTFNEWTIIIDRWMEHPPMDYLQYLLVWVQIRKIPVNYYTAEAITALGDLVGEVKEVAFEPEKPQSNEYVRVRVKFDVSWPVRRSKIVSLPDGESTTIWYDFERIQKRCYACQRLTHEKDKCPLLIKQRKEKALERRQRIMDEKQGEEPIIAVTDPLWGVLKEAEVGIDPNTGNLRIDLSVLQSMREYLIAVEGPKRKIREERLKKSIKELENDVFGQRSMLRLLLPPAITSDINKGKGLVYEKRTATKNSFCDYHLRLLF